MRTAKGLLGAAVLCAGISAVGCCSSNTCNSSCRSASARHEQVASITTPSQIPQETPIATKETDSRTETAHFESTPPKTSVLLDTPNPQLTVVSQVTPSNPAIPTSDPPPVNQPPLPVARSSDTPATTEAESSLAHAEDYSWLQGTLEYVHIKGAGRWKLRYAPLWAEDRFGGSVALDPDAWLEKYHEGDVIYVEGEIEESTSDQGSSPVYRVRSIRAARAPE